MLRMQLFSIFSSLAFGLLDTDILVHYVDEFG